MTELDEKAVQAAREATRTAGQSGHLRATPVSDVVLRAAITAYLDAAEIARLRAGAGEPVGFDMVDWVEKLPRDPTPALRAAYKQYKKMFEPAPPAPALPSVDAAKAGWNACRKSVYAVCEDVGAENEQHRSDTDNEPRHHFGRGGMAAAKSIARGFNALEAEDDDNFIAAVAALATVEDADRG